MEFSLGLQLKKKDDNGKLEFIKQFAEFKNNSPLWDAFGVEMDCYDVVLTADCFNDIINVMNKKREWFETFNNDYPTFKEHEEEILDDFDHWCNVVFERFCENQESCFKDFADLWSLKDEIYYYLHQKEFAVTIWCKY